jgi:hypothetical protein
VGGVIVLLRPLNCVVLRLERGEDMVDMVLDYIVGDVSARLPFMQRTEIIEQWPKASPWHAKSGPCEFNRRFPIPGVVRIDLHPCCD